MKVSNIAPFGVRMPPELKARLEKSAKKNGRSLNAELVFWLQKAMDAEDEEQEEAVDGFRYIEGLKITPRESQAMKYMADRDDPLKMVESLLLDVRDLLRGKDEDK